MIENRVVSRRTVGRFRRELRMRQEAERAEPVVRGHDDDAFLRESRPVVRRRRSRSARPCAAVDPDHHRPPVVLCLRGRPHIQIETVFARRLRRRGVRRAGGIRLLHAFRAERVGAPDAAPCDDRLRRPPPQRPERRRGEWNAFEDANTVRRRAADLPAVDLDRVGRCRCEKRCGADKRGDADQSLHAFLPFTTG